MALEDIAQNLPKERREELSAVVDELGGKTGIMAAITIAVLTGWATAKFTG